MTNKNLSALAFKVQKTSALSKQVLQLLSEKLNPRYIVELEAFCHRNNLKHDDENREIILCCPSCLKAYAMKIAEAHNLDEDSIEFVMDVLDGEIGHEGYYIDDDELLEVD